jgi:hypothetical protein
MANYFTAYAQVLYPSRPHLTKGLTSKGWMTRLFAFLETSLLMSRLAIDF